MKPTTLFRVVIKSASHLVSRRTEWAGLSGRRKNAIGEARSGLVWFPFPTPLPFSIGQSYRPFPDTFLRGWGGLILSFTIRLILFPS